MDVFFYERNIPNKYGNEHFHLQVFAIPENLTDNVKKVLEYEGKRCDVQEWLETDSLLGLVDLVADENSYFAIQFPNGKIFYTLNTEKISVQFGRKIFCFVLNLLDKIDWKSCVVSNEKETQMTDNFRKDFSIYAPVAKKEEENTNEN